MQSSSGISKEFFSFPVQIIHFLGLPLFFILFLTIYRPEPIMKFLATGRVSLAFNITILAGILLLVLVGTRLAFFFLRKQLSMSKFGYALWCLGEIAVFSAFGALYLTLISPESEDYFAVLLNSLLYFLGVLVWAYAVLGFWIESRHKDSAPSDVPPENDSMVRFTDDSQRLKLAVAASSILYVQANVNYVNIYYLDSDKVKKYQLRSSMKRLEDTLQGHGLRRCHRAYFINPAHVKILRKDEEGLVFADLDIAGCQSIPVSKTYYDSIAAIL